jgi:RimJ/RimL family protein N-acetyltransferase
MKLLPLDTSELIEIGAKWLSDDQNYQWLDFTDGLQRVGPMSLRFMLQKDSHLIRVYTNDRGEPIGLVGLSRIDRRFKTAWLWAVLGDKKHSGGGLTGRACSALLSLGFRDLGLRAIETWVVEDNHPSIRIANKLGMKSAGRLRKCHSISGKVCDRLLFDLLVSEHVERGYGSGEDAG